MNIIEIIISSIALASDAFAIAISKGIALNKVKIKNCIKIALWFSIFQGLMPTLGYITTKLFKDICFTYDFIISFILLLYMGVKMIYDTLKNKNTINNSLNFTEMLMFSIATSIDAYSFGIAYFLGYDTKNILLCFTVISIITFILSFIGTLIGSKIGNKFEKFSKIIGGTILIILSFNVIFDHI